MDPTTFDLHVAWFRDYAAEAGIVDRSLGLYCAGASSILELGCGTGNLMLALAALGYDLSGLDNDEAMLLRASEKLRAARRPARVMRADALDINSECGEYDAVVATFSFVYNFFPHTKLERFFHAACVPIRIGGLLILNGFSVETTRKTHPSGELILRGVNPLGGNTKPTYDIVT